MSIRRDELITKMIDLQADRKFGDWSRISEEYKLFSVMLSDEGWYMDYDLAVGTLSELYLNQTLKDTKVLDEYMIKFYKGKLRNTISFFKKHHQKRYPILEKAFKSHKKGEFELSIPVFLSQIEGLFFDLTSKEIFSKGRGEKKENTAREWLNSKKNDIAFLLAILEPLRENENITANFSESENYPNVLNRNKILHGRDLNYSSELNSYKAISLLSFIGTVVYDIENKSEKFSWL